MRAWTIIEAGPGDAGAIADVSIRSYEDAFGQPFYMDRDAAVRRWERYMRGGSTIRATRRIPGSCTPPWPAAGWRGSSPGT